MDDELRERIAVFRHGVIRDLVAGPLAPGEKERLLAEIVERDWMIPGTSRCRVGRSTARIRLSVEAVGRAVRSSRSISWTSAGIVRLDPTSPRRAGFRPSKP